MMLRLRAKIGGFRPRFWPFSKASQEKPAPVEEPKDGSLVTHTDQAVPKDGSLVTHTGQTFAVEDYRNIRFVGYEKTVNPNWAVDLVAEDPIVVCEKRVVFSDAGGALGHPRVFINLDPPNAQICGYSGRRFIQKKYYNEAEHGPSITYDEYIKQMNPEQKDWPN